MTGWRLGWMLVPPDLARSVECLAQNFYISPPALSQLAALPVFGCRAELDGHVARYRANRDLLIRALKAAGLTRFAPAEGAFYLYVDISSLTRDSEDFCRRLLAETGVAVTPGLDFDPIHGGGWIRFSFAGSTEDVPRRRAASPIGCEGWAEYHRVHDPAGQKCEAAGDYQGAREQHQHRHAMLRDVVPAGMHHRERQCRQHQDGQQMDRAPRPPEPDRVDEKRADCDDQRQCDP